MLFNLEYINSVNKTNVSSYNGYLTEVGTDTP